MILFKNKVEVLFLDSYEIQEVWDTERCVAREAKGKLRTVCFRKRIHRVVNIPGGVGFHLTIKSSHT